MVLDSGPIKNFFLGNVSRASLLTYLLPLSFSSLILTLVYAAMHFPVDYNWRNQVISHLISPRYNPDFAIPAVGMAISALLALPFAGYLGQRLPATSPRLAHFCWKLLWVGIFLVMTVTLPLNVPSMPKIQWMHEALARTAFGAIVLGMLCCSVCALKDLPKFGGKGSLHKAVALVWVSLTLLPVSCGVFAGILRLARKSNFEWAHQTRLHLKQTMLWQLAFWEWIAVITFMVFILISTLLLPGKIKKTS